MVATQHALLQMAMNEEVSRYVAHLEKKAMHLLLDNLRCRTVLELLTDESWDDEQFPEDAEGLRKIARDALVKRVGLSEEDAAAVVRERWGVYNAQAVPESTATYLAGRPAQTKRPTLMPLAEAVEVEDEGTPKDAPVGYDLEKHKRGLEIAARNREKR